MAFRPNYGMQRNDRNRAAQARSEEKIRKRESFLVSANYPKIEGLVP